MGHMNFFFLSPSSLKVQTLTCRGCLKGRDDQRVDSDLKSCMLGREAKILGGKGSYNLGILEIKERSTISSRTLGVDSKWVHLGCTSNWSFSVDEICN